jgi:hypothetical protein
LFPFLAVLALQGLFWISSDGTGYLAQSARQSCQVHWIFCVPFRSMGNL